MPLETAIPVAPSHLAVLLLDSFRYCLGRRSYAVSEFAEILALHWASVPAPWQDLVRREIREAIASECAGDACDVATWEQVLALP